MGRLRRAALVVAGVLVITTVVVGVAAERTTTLPSDGNCVVNGYVVYQTDESASEFEADRVARYEDLSGPGQALLDRAIASEGEEVPVESAAEGRVARTLDVDAVVRDGTVYRDRTSVRCPLISGVSAALNPYLRPLFFLYLLFSGPLLPLAVLGVAGVVAYAVGEWAEY